MTEPSADPAIAIGFKLIADRRDIGDHLSVVSLHLRASQRRTRQAHQAASFGDGDAVGPGQDRMQLGASRPRHAFQRPRSAARASSSKAQLEFFYPDRDQVARDVAAFLASTWSVFGRNEVEGDLSLNSTPWVRCWPWPSFLLKPGSAVNSTCNRPPSRAHLPIRHGTLSAL